MAGCKRQVLRGRTQGRMERRAGEEGNFLETLLLKSVSSHKCSWINGGRQAQQRSGLPGHGLRALALQASQPWHLQS